VTKRIKTDELLNTILRSSSLASTQVPSRNLAALSLFKLFPEEKIRIELEEKLEAMNGRHQKEMEELRAEHRSIKKVRTKHAQRPKDARTMIISILKGNYPSISQRELCAKLDAATERNAMRGPLPSWKKKTWVDAYNDPKTRPKLKVYLSKR
jgi:hypothetical protein